MDDKGKHKWMYLAIPVAVLAAIFLCALLCMGYWLVAFLLLAAILLVVAAAFGPTRPIIAGIGLALAHLVPRAVAACVVFYLALLLTNRIIARWNSNAIEGMKRTVAQDEEFSSHMYRFIHATVNRERDKPQVDKATKNIAEKLEKLLDGLVGSAGTQVKIDDVAQKLINSELGTEYNTHFASGTGESPPDVCIVGGDATADKQEFFICFGLLVDAASAPYSGGAYRVIVSANKGKVSNVLLDLDELHGRLKNGHSGEPLLLEFPLGKTDTGNTNAIVRYGKLIAPTIPETDDRRTRSGTSDDNGGSTRAPEPTMATSAEPTAAPSADSETASVPEETDAAAGADSESVNASSEVPLAELVDLNKVVDRISVGYHIQRFADWVLNAKDAVESENPLPVLDYLERTTNPKKVERARQVLTTGLLAGYFDPDDVRVTMSASAEKYVPDKIVFFPSRRPILASSLETPEEPNASEETAVISNHQSQPLFFEVWMGNVVKVDGITIEKFRDGSRAFVEDVFIQPLEQTERAFNQPAEDATGRPAQVGLMRVNLRQAENGGDHVLDYLTAPPLVSFETFRESLRPWLAKQGFPLSPHEPIKDDAGAPDPEDAFQKDPSTYLVDVYRNLSNTGSAVQFRYLNGVVQWTTLFAASMGMILLGFRFVRHVLREYLAVELKFFWSRRLSESVCRITEIHESYRKNWWCVAARRINEFLDPALPDPDAVPPCPDSSGAKMPSVTAQHRVSEKDTVLSKWLRRRWKMTIIWLFRNQRSMQLVRAVTTAAAETEDRDKWVQRAQSQSDQIANRMDSEYALLSWIVWLVPSLGFLGTILGIGGALGFADRVVSASDAVGQTLAIQAVTHKLSVAFDTTLVALAVAIIYYLTLSLCRRIEDWLLLRAETMVLEVTYDLNEAIHTTATNM